MDSGDFIYVVFFAIWLFGQIAAARKKYQQQQAAKQAAKQQAAPTQGDRAAPAQPPPPLPVPTTVSPMPAVGESMLTILRETEAEIEATLGELDEQVRTQVSYLVEHDFRPRARQLQIELRNETPPEFTRAVQQTQRLASHYRGVLQTARIHSGLRQRRDLGGSQLVADRLITDLDTKRAVTNPLPPAVAIVWDVAANDPLRQSALADSTLFIPRTVLQDASHWSLVAPEISRYLVVSAPTIYEEIHEGLGLGVAEAEIGTDTDALTRVLFASWLGRIVADAVGALYLGPAYLSSLAQLYAQPQAPARVTSIVLNQDGTVGAEPPAHVRVHVNAQWVASMGYASEATAIVRDWDERHGSPSALGFWGSMTSLPAAPILDTATELTEALFQLPLEAFGNVRLAHVPGLAGWASHAHEAHDAKASLLAGKPAVGSARAIVAAAIEAALEKPEANAELNRLLDVSIAGANAEPRTPTRIPVKQTQQRTPPPVTVSHNPFASLTGRDAAEALILGEIIL